MNKKQEKPNIVFVCSCGHSGSTLLDMILGSSKDCFSMGEIKNWNKYFLEKSYKRCVCGDLSKCDFWRKIKNKESYNHNILPNKKLAIKELLYMVNLQNSDSLKVKSDDYYKIVKEIKKYSKAKVLIDSSKRLRQLYKLSELKRQGLINLKVLFIRKKMPALMYSYTKVKDNYHYRMLFDWIYVYRNGVKYVKDNDIDYMFFEYEDFIQNNDKMISEIAKFVDLDLSNWKNDIKVKKYHNIGGNPMRFKKFEKLYLDDKYKTRLSKFDLLIASTLEKIVKKK